MLERGVTVNYCDAFGDGLDAEIHTASIAWGKYPATIAFCAINLDV